MRKRGNLTYAAGWCRVAFIGSGLAVELVHLPGKLARVLVGVHRTDASWGTDSPAARAGRGLLRGQAHARLLDVTDLAGGNHAREDVGGRWRHGAVRPVRRPGPGG